MNHFQ